MNIFLDFDETLVHSLGQWKGEFIVEDKLDHFFVDIGGGELYVTHIRPCAKELIDLCKKFTNDGENLYILTVGTQSYLDKTLPKCDFGIRPEKVFVREDLSMQLGACPKFEGQPNVLIDNRTLASQQLERVYNKITFLDDPYYYKVPDFYSYLKDTWDLDLDDIRAFLERVQDDIIKFKA